MDKAELKRLASLHHYDILDTEPEPDFDRLTRFGAALFRVPVCAIGLLDEKRVWCKSIIGVSTHDTPREHSFCTHAIRRTDRPFVVPDASVDPRFSANPYVLGPPKVRFYAGAPVISSDGEAIGIFCIVDYVPRPGGLAAQELVLLDDLANLAVTLMENRLERKMLHDTERRLHHSQSELETQLRARNERISKLEISASELG